MHRLFLKTVFFAFGRRGNTDNADRADLNRFLLHFYKIPGALIRFVFALKNNSLIQNHSHLCIFKTQLLKATTKAHLALLGTNIFFAMNFTAIKYLVNEGFAKPFGINLVRIAVSSVLLWILFFIKPTKVVIQKKDVGRFLLCALLGIAVNQLLFVKGLSLTYSIHAALLLLITPILITILAAFLLKERLNNFKIAGLLLGIGGAAILIGSRESTGNANDVLLGDILVILNAIAYTFYFILVKPLMKTYNPVAIIRIIFTVGFFIMLPFCWNEFEQINFRDFTAAAWLSMFIVSFTGTFLAYLLNIYGIKILGAGMAGTYIYSQPFFAAAIAMVYLNESFTWMKIVAAIFIFLGVYLTNKKAGNA